MCQEVSFSLVWSFSENVGLPVTNLGSSQKGQLPYNGKSISAKFDVISLPKCAHPKYQMHIPIIPNTHPGIANTRPWLANTRPKMPIIKARYPTIQNQSPPNLMFPSLPKRHQEEKSAKCRITHVTVEWITNCNSAKRLCIVFFLVFSSKIILST